MSRPFFRLTTAIRSRQAAPPVFFFLLVLLPAFIALRKVSAKTVLHPPTVSLPNARPAFGDTAGKEVFYVLYLENTPDKPQVYQLLKKRHNKRVVLQFYRIAGTDSLGLYAYSGKKTRGFRFNRSRFDSTDVQKLALTGMVGASLISKEFILGGLQLNEEGVKKLRKNMVRPNEKVKKGFEYFWFIPLLQKDAVTGARRLAYRIEPSDEKPEKGKVLEQKTTTAFAMANPSPPKNPY